MKTRLFLILALALALGLAACGAPQPLDGPGMVREPDLTARIIRDDGTDLLLVGLAEPWDSVYTVSKADLEAAGVYTEDLRPGELMVLDFDGDLEDTLPARLGNVSGVAVMEDSRDLLFQLYLNALDDLWNKDPALHDGVTQIGFDLASTRLAPSERAALAMVFAQDHGVPETVFGTWQELADAGVIDGEELVWDDGVLLSIQEKNDEPGKVLFDAEIWRSGLGAYLFCDCESKQLIGGDWEPYTVGSEAIS